MPYLLLIEDDQPLRRALRLRRQFSLGNNYGSDDPTVFILGVLRKVAQ